MILIILKLNVLKNRNFDFRTFFALFVKVLPNRSGTGAIIFLMKYMCLFCFAFFSGEFVFVMIFSLYTSSYTHVVVIKVCYLILRFVFSSSPINIKFHLPSNVTLAYSISGLFNGCIFLKVFILW